MFSFMSRSILRRTTGAGLVVGGLTLTKTQHFPQTTRCEGPSPPMEGSKKSFRSSNSFRSASSVKTSGCPIGIGKKFLQLYMAEFADANGKINLHAVISFAEAKHMLVAAGAKGKDVKEMFDLMDTDNANTVDFSKIMAFFLDFGVGSFQEKGLLFFHACDIDGSNSIEPAELKDIIHHMMLLKKETDGKDSFMGVNHTLYAGIPETFVMHFKANELVNDVFTSASKDGLQITEKEFQTWLLRGGKHVNRLKALFGL